MLSVMQIFKIVFGVILSLFILVLFMRFSESYTEIGESGRDVEILMGLKKTIEDVYNTGIPTDFDTGNLEEIISFYSPPSIETPVTSVNLDPVPVFLVPGERISIHRTEYDTGWWKFYFVQALPETKIVFVPLGRSEVVWNTMGNITKYLPSTEDTDTKVLFGVGCNDTGGQPVFFFLNWEGGYFTRTVLPYFFDNDYDFVPCVEREGYRIVTISETPVDKDFQVVPVDNQMGYVYINDTLEGQQAHLYKNPLDIISLLFGGKKLYDYENRKFLKELSIASDIASREAGILMAKVSNPDCAYSSFIQRLGSVKALANGGEYTNEDEMRELNRKIREASEIYKGLEEMGC
jgi:hypothetical protein